MQSTKIVTTIVCLTLPLCFLFFLLFFFWRGISTTVIMVDDPPLTPSPSPSPIGDNNAANNYALLIIGTITLFILSVATVSRYGNLKSQPWYVSTVCIIGWCFPFWIVLLLPLDISSVYIFSSCYYHCCCYYTEWKGYYYSYK